MGLHREGGSQFLGVPHPCLARFGRDKGGVFHRGQHRSRRPVPRVGRALQLAQRFGPGQLLDLGRDIWTPFKPGLRQRCHGVHLLDRRLTGCFLYTALLPAMTHLNRCLAYMELPSWAKSQSRTRTPIAPQKRNASRQGRCENSPALQCRESSHEIQSPVGTAEFLRSVVPTGLRWTLAAYPGLKSWAIFTRSLRDHRPAPAGSRRPTRAVRTKEHRACAPVSIDRQSSGMSS